MSLKALLLDVDGTLADTEPNGHLPAYNRAFDELGLNWRWSPELYREMLAMPGGRERIAHYLDQGRAQLAPEQRQLLEQDAQAWIDHVHATKSRHFQHLVETGQVPLRSGVQRLIVEAKSAGLRLAIVTNASRRTLEPFLKHTLGPGLRAEIDFVVSGELVARKKPAPDLYKMALLRLGVTASECIAIEDSEMGLEAAHAAGIATLITVNEDTRHHDFAEAALVVDQLGEPDQPFRVLAGNAGSARWVTLALLKRLLRFSQARDEEE